MTLSLRAGVDWSLENEADALLAAHRRETATTTAEKTETLTENQMNLRWGREVYNGFGVADPAIVRGQYSREFNPEFGQRPSRHQRFDD